MERYLAAEMTVHLEAERDQPNPDKTTNRRNGHSQKTLKGEFGTAQIVTPRDRNGELLTYPFSPDGNTILMTCLRIRSI